MLLEQHEQPHGAQEEDEVIIGQLWHLEQLSCYRHSAQSRGVAVSEPGVTCQAHLPPWVPLPGRLVMAEICLNHPETQAVSPALEQDQGQDFSGPRTGPGIPKTQPWEHREVLRAKAFSRHQDANKNR